MIADLRPYPTYRDSGVPWLGAIPSHWAARRLRQVVELRVSNVDKIPKENERPIRLCNYVDVYKNERITSKLLFMQATATPEEVDRFALAVGDILVTKDSESWNDIGVPALVEYAAPDLLCGYHLAMMRPLAGLQGEFLLRVLQSQGVAAQFHVEANGVTRFGLTQAAIKNVLIPLAPVAEQYGIARFLDYADRRIKRYIRAKRQLIGLLNEQKQAIIDRAVTRGLDPNVRLKPSGVEWLGDIPEHWRIAPLKTAVTIQSGLTLGKNYPAGTILEPMPYLRVANVQVGYLNLAEVKTLPVPKWEAQRYLLRPNDVLMTEGGDPDKLGRGCLWQGQIELCLHQNHIFAVRTDEDQLRPRFLEIYLSTKMAKDYFIRSAKQTTNLASTNKTAIGNLPAILPPVNEQDVMLSLIDSQVAKLDQALTAAKQEIDLLREYRTRLIADVVTGKLDVRAAAAALPAELEADEELPELDEVEAEDGDEAELADAEA